MELKDRLKKARKLAGLTQTQVSASVKGLTQPSYSALERGESKSTTKIAELSALFNVNSIWLATGEGEISANLLADTKPISGWDDSTPLDDDEFEIPYYENVTVTAGSTEGEVQEKTDRKIRMSKSSARKAGASATQSFSYTASGDSMAEKIADGARCTADASKKEIKDGKIYVFRHGVMRRTKYLFRKPDGSLLIRSHNSNYEDEIVPVEDLDQIEILGWVWEWSNMERW